MPREATRRIALGALLAVAAGVSVGDDVVSAPDARRGSRTMTLELTEELGTSSLHVPRTPATGVAMLLHDGDLRPLAPLMDALAASTLLVPVDAGRLAGAAPLPCSDVVERLALASRRAQREAGSTTYRPPLVVGAGGAARFARDLVSTSDPTLFPAGLGTSEQPALGESARCTAPGGRRGERRWRSVGAAALPSAAIAALAREPPAPSTGHRPLDRWLAHFVLPLSAAWATKPRAVLILMSDAHGLRPADARLADGLAEEGISVLSVDALRYFWQRRSPRDVSFELKRLIDALESLDIPVIVGGTGFGAETMAVAARHVDGTPLAGLVLITPGPSAYFEVEPPLPALVSLIRDDWSTADAVAALAVPTLCVSSGVDRARALCTDLSSAPHVTATPVEPTTSSATEALIARIASFVDGIADNGTGSS